MGAHSMPNPSLTLSLTHHQVRLSVLKREEEALAREEERLALDRARHIR
jgi:hypothetical protein